MKFSVLHSGVVAVCFLALMLLIAMKVETDAARTFNGRYRVADGDSLSLGHDRLRLLGIDAPELKQTCRRDGEVWRCGEAARQTLASLVEGRAVMCKGDRKDKYQRMLVTCRDGDININRQMVRRGMAFSFGDYQRDEDAAKSAHIGLWSGKVERPSDWRRTHAHSAAMEDEGPHLPSFFQRLFGGQ
ncbi:MAG: nuclease SNase-like protein [Rhizobium sp.]|nr:nuclease SNase-like protein [Rhizobium sp.]